MANQPIFVAGYRQDGAILRADMGNAAQTVFTPGANGTRLHAIVLGNDGDAASDPDFLCDPAEKRAVPDRRSGLIRLVRSQPRKPVAMTNFSELSARDEGGLTFTTFSNFCLRIF